MLDKFVDAATDRALETEELGQDSQAEVANRFVEILNNPEQRSEEIWNWFIAGWLEATSADMDEQEAVKVAADLTVLLNQTFDELNEVPTFERSPLWEVAAEIMIAAASRQAQIMSGMTQKAMIDGIENGGDLVEEAADLDKSELEGAHIEIASELKRKRKEKNGNS